MTDQLKKEIRQLIREEFKNIFPDIFGRTLLQVKEYFLKNIK